MQARSQGLIQSKDSKPSLTFSLFSLKNNLRQTELALKPENKFSSLRLHIINRLSLFSVFKNLLLLAITTRQFQSFVTLLFLDRFQQWCYRIAVKCEIFNTSPSKQFHYDIYGVFKVLQPNYTFHSKCKSSSSRK